jgi:hypothetical protein
MLSAYIVIQLQTAIKSIYQPLIYLLPVTQRVVVKMEAPIYTYIHHFYPNKSVKSFLETNMFQYV